FPNDEGFVSRRCDAGVRVVDGAGDYGDPVDLGYSLQGGYGDGGGVWRGKWGPIVAESGECGGWEEEVRWCDGGGRN
ncbi:hypothetical protein Tco_1241136, partial [Tanacetum coccineum]